MADTFVETPADEATSRTELVAAVFLGIAAVLTALSAYNAALSDGDALNGYARSTRTLSDANAFFAQGNSTSSGDQALFVDYASARFEGNDELADYLTSLMRPTLLESIEFWEATDEAITPFDDLEGNPYVVEDFEEANLLEAEATALFDEGSEADDAGDEFELATVIFAITLFFGGIANLFRPPPLKVALVAIAGVLLVIGLIILIPALGS